MMLKGSINKHLWILVYFVIHDGNIDAAGLVAAGTDHTVKGVAAITLYIGITSIIDDIIGGSGNPPTPIDIGAINNSISNNQI